MKVPAIAMAGMSVCQGFGAAGEAWPKETESANKRQRPSTGAKASSKFTCVGTEGKKPAMRIMPLGSICGSKVSCGSITATPDKSILSRRCWAKISASRAAVLVWKPGAPDRATPCNCRSG